MKKVIFFIFILSVIQTQNLFVDGVAAVVEDQSVRALRGEDRRE